MQDQLLLKEWARLKIHVENTLMPGTQPEQVASDNREHAMRDEARRL